MALDQVLKTFNDMALLLLPVEIREVRRGEALPIYMQSTSQPRCRSIGCCCQCGLVCRRAFALPLEVAIRCARSARCKDDVCGGSNGEALPGRATTRMGCFLHFVIAASPLSLQLDSSSKSTGTCRPPTTRGTPQPKRLPPASAVIQPHAAHRQTRMHAHSVCTNLSADIHPRGRA